MFERILSIGKPDVIQKYAATFEGKQPSDCATIEEGKQLSLLLASASPRHRNGLSLPIPLLIANGGGLGETYFNAAEMLDEGFPANKPIHLHLRYDFGTHWRMIEVFDAAYQIASLGEVGYKRVFSSLERGE